MRILLAAPDRDLLKVYRQLLTLHGHTVSVCFEGTQALKTAAVERFDAAVADSLLPSIDTGRLAAYFHERQIPVIVLTHRKPGTALLLEKETPNAYLPFPFLPAELVSLLEAVRQKAQSAEKPVYGDVCVDTAGFRIDGTQIRLTNQELDILSALGAGEAPPQRGINVYVNALNRKFAAAGKKCRIVYQYREGFRFGDAL
ncbi:MAG: response regulator transcription factor [Clostridia bacterium]|nr:response regulator transcription factor [Clostridia bacterium]MBQ9507016.1 response regulator transcription factor [Clostridia bacterium]